MLRKLVHGIDALNHFISSAAMWLILPLTGVLLYDAFMRYFMNAPTIWGMELGLMIFGAYMILAGPSSIMQKVQVGVDIFTGRLRPRARGSLNCVTYVFTLIFFAGLLYTSALYALESWQMREFSSSAWGQPIYHIKALIPVAMLLMLLQSFAEFLRNLHLARTGESLS